MHFSRCADSILQDGFRSATLIENSAISDPVQFSGSKLRKREGPDPQHGVYVCIAQFCPRGLLVPVFVEDKVWSWRTNRVRRMRTSLGPACSVWWERRGAAIGTDMSSRSAERLQQDHSGTAFILHPDPQLFSLRIRVSKILESTRYDTVAI